MNTTIPHALRHAVAAVVYVSEGSNEKILTSLKTIVKEAATTASVERCSTSSLLGASLLNVFSDPHYNRSSFVIAGSVPDAVAQTAFALTKAALKAIPDLREHDATHPRIGIVDHISFAPLCPSEIDSVSTTIVPTNAEEATTTRTVHSQHDNIGVNMEDAAIAAARLSESLALDLQLPVMVYGAARAKLTPVLPPRTLAATRRQTPYFCKQAKNSGLAGSSEGEFVKEEQDRDNADIWAEVVPDLGGPVVDPRVGLCCCGAVQLVLNYNVRLNTTDRKVAAACVAAVRTRKTRVANKVGVAGGNGGSGTNGLYTPVEAVDPRYAGLPHVEALPLKHENGNFEVACNLLDPSVTPPSLVLDRVAEVAKKQFGVEVDDAYTIGMTVGQIRSRLQLLTSELEPRAIK